MTVSPLAAAPVSAEDAKAPASSTFVLFAPFILVAAGCLHAVIQEQLMHDLSHLPLLITSFEFGCCAVLSLVMLLVQRQDPTDAPRLSLLRISLLVLASLVSGNVALKWVSYPVKVSIYTCRADAIPRGPARAGRWRRRARLAPILRTRACC